MIKIPFGKTGLQATPLGFGGAEVGYLPVERERVANILNLLLDGGVTVIDTAASYAGSEELIGQSIGHRRSEFILISKCGSKVQGTEGEPWSPQLITQTVDRSLKNLKTDRLDVMLLHSCDLATLKKGDALGALVKAREAGKIRFCGYSGDNEAAAHAATMRDIAVIETSISIADQANIDAVLPKAREANIGVLAKRPIANAAWRKPAEQQGIYQGYADTYHKRLNAMKLDPASLGFRGESGNAADAWAEMALRFTLSHPAVHSAIIGTTNPENVKKNLRYAQKGPLPADEVEKVRAAFRKAEAAAGEKWTGQT